MRMNPTPTLSGKEADNFFARVAEGLKRKADFIPTPRLEEARKRFQRGKLHDGRQ